MIEIRDDAEAAILTSPKGRLRPNSAIFRLVLQTLFFEEVFHELLYLEVNPLDSDKSQRHCRSIRVPARF
jgi:hypothetical protein